MSVVTQHTTSAVSRDSRPPGDDVLSVHDGTLHIEDVAAAELADRFGTPLYVVSERQLRTNIRAWRAAAANCWPHGPTAVLASLKANTEPALRAILNAEGAGCDVFGVTELELALASGLSGDLISLTGPAKPDTALQKAIEAGALVTLDSADEYRRVVAIARRTGRPARVRLRLRPWIPTATAASDLAPPEEAIYLTLQDYRAGMPAHEVNDCLAAGEKDPDVEIVGVHAHASRQTTDLPFWRDYAEHIGVRTGELAKRFPYWRPMQIDLGGGFAVPRDPTGQRRNSAQPSTPAPDAYMGAIAEGLDAGLTRTGFNPQGVELQVEPGRALYGNAGIHLTRILHVKHQDDPLPRTWYERDTSETFLPDTIVEANAWTMLVADEPHRPVTEQAAVTGASCGFDQIFARQAMPRVTAGELLAILDTGAYQDVTANNFNLMPRPPTVLVSESRAALARRRETIDDVLARDTPPIEVFAALGRARTGPQDMASTDRKHPNPLEILSLEQLRERTSLKWRTHPREVLPLWVAEMDVPLAEPIVRAVTDAVRRGDTGYPAGTGYAEAWAGFAARRWQWSGLAVDRSAVVPDVMRGIVEAIQLVTEPGNAVVINTPAYPPFYAFVEHAGRRIVEAPLTPTHRLNTHTLEEAFQRANGRGAFLLCNPHNPTGTVFSASELATVADLADRYRIRVIADEIHAPLTYPGVPFHPYLSVAGSDNAFCLLSASKGWNLAGLKAGLLVAGPHAAADLRRLPEEVGHGPSHLGVIAHTAALRDAEDWLDALIAGLATNRSRLTRLLAEQLPQVRWSKPEGTYFAWLDCRALTTDQENARQRGSVTAMTGVAAQFLERGTVALSCGPAFGTSGTGYVRLNMATSTSILTEAVRRMATAVP